MIMEAQKVEELKAFVQQCKENISILLNPSLAFFRSYLESLGARISSTPPPGKNDVDSDEDIVESDIELDQPDVLQPDSDPPQRMGDSSIEVTEESQAAAQLLKSKAIGAVSEGNLDEAINHLTEAIMLNPKSAILYATRASVFVKLRKPNAAIRDANAALEVNPDSAKGYKARGMARAMLGFWEEAASDLRLASNLDYDEDIGAMLRKVQPNAHKLEDHRRKYERLRTEKKLNKMERERKRQAERQDPGAVLEDGKVIGICSIVELDDKLNAASRASRLAIMYFTASWCGPCRYMSPIYTRWAKEHPEVVFLKIDIEEAGLIAQHRKITSIPTFLYIKDGKEIDRVVGADKNTIERRIAAHATR